MVSIKTFNAGIVSEAKEIKNKIISDVQKFKQRVAEAVENVMNRVSDSGVAVKECVDVSVALFNCIILLFYRSRSNKHV